MTQRVFVDANVLFSKTLTDWLFLLREANPHMFTVHTSEDVLAETIANMRKRKPGAPGHVTRRRLELIRSALNGVVQNYPGQDDAMAPAFTGTDDEDYHVHAAASAIGAQIIVTANAAQDITTNPDDEVYEIHHPDDFFCLVAHSSPASLTPVVRQQLTYWKKQPGHLQLDDALRRADCLAFAEEVRHALQQVARSGWCP